jgi:hypothetical protein
MVGTLCTRAGLFPAEGNFRIDPLAEGPNMPFARTVRQVPRTTAACSQAILNLLVLTKVGMAFYEGGYCFHLPLAVQWTLY